MENNIIDFLQENSIDKNDIESIDKLTTYKEFDVYTANFKTDLITGLPVFVLANDKKNSLRMAEWNEAMEILEELK